MNTRLQVEHPVTEAITGLDLVEWQLRIAAGEPLDIEPEASGHAIEARLYAESPARGFLPSAGKLMRLRFPDNVRVDTGVHQGDSVPVHYDPMVAKLIAHGPSREAARRDLIEALEKTEIAGIEHNAGYLRNLLAHTRIRGGRLRHPSCRQHTRSRNPGARGPALGTSRAGRNPGRRRPLVPGRRLARQPAGARRGAAAAAGRHAPGRPLPPRPGRGRRCPHSASKIWIRAPTRWSSA